MKLKISHLPVNVIVPMISVLGRMPAPPPVVKVFADTGLLFISRLPALKLIDPSTVNPSCNVQPPPSPLKVICDNVLPPVVIVLPVVVDVNSKPTPVKGRLLIVIPGTSFNEPDIFNEAKGILVNAGLLTTPVQSIFTQLTIGVLIFTDCPEDGKEFTSKNTLSKNVGEHPSGLPPLLSDQWLPSFQFPEPPTQYRSRGVCALIVQPLLFPVPMELFAMNVAPPVAFISWRLI